MKVDSDRQVVIVSAVRLPAGRFLGMLAPLSAVDLGAAVIREAVQRAGIEPECVDEVLMGNVVSAGLGQSPSRQAALLGGIPDTVPVLTVNQVCGSGLKTVLLAEQAIRAGDGEVFVAGGMESMSNAPYLLRGARQGYRLGHAEVIDANINDGLWCAVEGQHMGTLADATARQRGLGRREQDEFALMSHRRSVAAIEAGRLRDEIVPVRVQQRQGEVEIDRDELPRPDTSLEALSRLPPAFVDGGTVTAGNASALADGAAALVIMSDSRATRAGLQPLARITASSSVAGSPRDFLVAPAVAVRRLLERAGRRLDEFDLIEMNEAFSVAVLAVGQELDWDWSQVNVNGGAIALGHPIGASGARILTTLLYALRDRKLRHGLATACLGGGGAVAIAVEVD